MIARTMALTLILGELVDETAVDLDLVEREALQVAERGIAGPEIIECIRTPSSRSSCSAFRAASSASINTASVISSSSRRGLSPDAAKAFLMLAPKSLLRNCTGAAGA